MGLDVYLYKYEDFEDAKRREKEYSIFEETTWQTLLLGGYRGVPFGELSEEDRERYNAAYEDLSEEKGEEVNAKIQKFAEGLGLDKWGSASGEEGCECIEINSKRDPEHMFKIGYIRSSYNSGGINHLLREQIGKDLYWVFQDDYEETQYELKPDWGDCLKRSRQLLEEFRSHLENEGAFQVIRLAMNPFILGKQLQENGKPEGPTTEKEALELFLKQDKEMKERQKKYDESGGKGWEPGAYSTATGFFSPKAFKMRGLMMGIEDSFHSALGMPSMPCAYAVCEVAPEKEGELPYQWYLTALEIVCEMCEWVLGQDDSDKYVLHWSS